MHTTRLSLLGFCALWLALTLKGAAALRAAAPPPQDTVIRLVFDNTDVSDVLRAISLRTRANIVFPAQSKIPITINATARSTDEALRVVTAAARLVYRQIGDTYVVATPEGMRQAVEPFGERTRLTLNSLTPAEVITLLEGALPYLTVRPAGTQVLVIGATEDIEQARAILNEQDKPRTAEPQVSEVLRLQYAPANQVASMLKNMFPGLKADAIGAADKPGGAVGLVGSRSQVEGARDAVRIVDIPTAPAEPSQEYRVYLIKYSSAPVLKTFLEGAAPGVKVLVGPETYSPLAPGFRPLSGATLGTASTSGGLGGGLGGGFGGGSGGFGGRSGAGMDVAGGAEERRAKEGDRARSLVLQGAPEHLDAAVKLLEQVDLPPRQVMVDVKVVDASPERAEELGLKWNWTRFGFYEARPGTEVDTGNTNGIGGEFTNFFTRALGFGQFSRVPWSFQAVLTGMITRREAKLLASPSIQVTDNDDANIFIGDTIRTQIVSQGGAVNGTTIQVVEFPIGIILLVRPRINSDGNITLRVHPVVSTITGIDPETRLPQSSTREAETTVMVKDGETIVIGGLIREEMSRVVQEVPLLSRLPLVGELFRNRSTNRRKSEVLVFITPRIVK